MESVGLPGQAGFMGPKAGVDEPIHSDRDEHDEKVRFFANFLHSNRDTWERAIDAELANKRFRIPVELKDLRKAQEGLDRRVLKEPVKHLLAWEEALHSFLREINEKGARQLRQTMKLDIQGSFGRNHITPRGMNAVMLHQMVKVEGIVTKSGLMTPKLLQSMHVHADKDDGHVEQRDHRDATAFVNQPGAGAMPKQDAEGNKLAIEIGLSVYKDYQKFSVQEAPESSPAGQIPRSIEVVCEGDLADKAKPGDRVQVTGVYRPFPAQLQDFTTGVWPARLIATNVQLIKEMTEAPFVSDDVKHIKQIAARDDAFELLARSFAPSICGHEKVKAGLLLQMIGGAEKNLPNGTHLRGDINVLLVGDPSCGKSQMLRFVMNTAPLAISTTGRGSSGVGLTAAMIRDPQTRDFNLEAGAMVLADRGMICIDEFDKMSHNDRVAIHEAMEQQCVTIAKAGMHVTLNARCSVVAAANPKYGTFVPDQTLAANIGLPDSLLSRFDLVFIVRDNTNEEIDRRIATQVLRQAQQRVSSEGQRRGVEHVHSSILERRQEVDSGLAQEATEVFQRGVPTGDGEEVKEVLTVDFLRKYLRYCRRLTPKLTEEAQAEVSEKYVDMRMRFQSGFSEQQNPDAKRKPRLAVTTRTLEALIRLATAHAKLRLRKDEVLPEDVREAYKLMLQAREEDVIEPQAPPADVAPSDEAGQGGGAEAVEPHGQKRAREEQGEEGTRAAPMLSPGRFDSLRTLVARAFARSSHEQQLDRGELLENVNAELTHGEPAFTEDEFAAGLDRLEQQNKVMVLETGHVMFVG